jgi:hypothetical protein
VAAAVADVRERGSEVMAISDDHEFLASADTAFPLVPGVRLATLQGANVVGPAGLTKITLTH